LQVIDEDAPPATSVPPGRSERLRDVFQLLSPADLAALIGIDERTLAVWRSAHRGPDFVRLGRAIFYRRADVLAWVELNVTATDRAA
jgi:predicted DNA-binding transcriptional regulator AlpA